MDKEKIQQIIDVVKEKSGQVIKTVKNFTDKHKILTAVVSVVLAITLAVAVFVMDKLNRINYDDGSNPSLMYTEPSTDMTAQVIATTEKKGKFQSFKAADGSIVFTDGSYVNTLGAGVLNDGTTVYPTGIVVFQDGSYIIGSGIRVDKDGIATFSDGSQLHMSLFSIAKNGQILLKSPDGSLKIINNVAEQAVINSSQGSASLSPVSPQNPVTTTRPVGNSDILSNINNSGIGNNNTQNQAPIVNNTPVQDVDDIVIEDVMNNVDQSVKDELEQNDQAIEQNRNNKEIWYSDDVVNILLMGIDNGGKNYPYGRSDAMIVASVNKKTKAVKLISFSRTAYVAIDGYANTRLNHAHGYGGPALAIDTIEKNYKIRIDNYISTTFEAFKQLIDTLGGVDIGLTRAEIEDDTIKYALSLQGYTNLVPGTYTLNGYSALNYVRLRSVDSDRERTQRQRNVLVALANKAKSMSVIELNNALNQVLPYVTTDLSRSEILGQVMNVPSYLSGNMEQYVLPHKSSALQLIDGFEVVLVDWDSEINYTHEVFYGDVADVKYVTGYRV